MTDRPTRRAAVAAAEAISADLARRAALTEAERRDEDGDGDDAETSGEFLADDSESEGGLEYDSAASISAEEDEEVPPPTGGKGKKKATKAPFDWRAALRNLD
mmetsp:Transcript_2150/g.6799  ORF Transcript_2150/g.6799 Transcript_2150/m.6799 type:complete len:103 (-) Transcript_2150:191-499(-)